MFRFFQFPTCHPRPSSSYPNPHIWGKHSLSEARHRGTMRPKRWPFCVGEKIHPQLFNEKISMKMILSNSGISGSLGGHDFRFHVQFQGVYSEMWFIVGFFFNTFFSLPPLHFFLRKMFGSQSKRIPVQRDHPARLWRNAYQHGTLDVNLELMMVDVVMMMHDDTGLMVIIRVT